MAVEKYGRVDVLYNNIVGVLNGIAAVLPVMKKQQIRKLWFKGGITLERPFGFKAWMCGRVTMEEHFTFGHKLDLKQDHISTIPRTDYIANKDAKSYAVAADPSGKLGWTVEVLTEQVSDAYLAYLKNLGISYIFGGKDRLNFTVVVEKLKNLFSIDELMLEGGGFLNGSVTLFETSSVLTNQHPVNFFLKEVEKLDDGGLWLKYVTKRG